MGVFFLGERLASSSVFWTHCCSVRHCCTIDCADFKPFPWSGRQIGRFLGLCDMFKQHMRYLEIKRISDNLTKFAAASKFIVSKCG